MKDICRYLGDKEADLSSPALEEVKEGSYRQQSKQFYDYVDSNNIYITDESFYQEKDILEVVLVAAEEKKGAMMRATLPDREPLNQQIESINSVGGDCYVIPNTVMVEGEEWDNSIVYLTKDYDYRSFSDKELPFDNGAHKDHRGLGEFFGYPEEEIEAYAEHGMWPHGFTQEDNSFVPLDYVSGTEHVFPPYSAAKQYGEDEETVKKVEKLTSYSVRDSPDSVEKLVDTAEDRYRKLQNLEEEYGVELTSMI